MEAYVKGKELGRGAMGTVFLATRRADGAAAELNSSEQKASLREVHLLAQLRHPNIIGYVDAFLEHSELYIVMEQAGGGSLEDELKAARNAGAPIAEARLLDLLGQVGGALHYMHSCRVLHRDIKPANILLDAAGTPKLADFGISETIRAHRLRTGRALSALEDSASREGAAPKQLTSGLEGTPYYLAPELFEDTLQMDNCGAGRNRTPNAAEACAQPASRYGGAWRLAQPSADKTRQSPPWQRCIRMRVTCGRSASSCTSWCASSGRTAATRCRRSRIASYPTFLRTRCATSLHRPPPLATPTS